jgi:hypothetical protein
MCAKGDDPVTIEQEYYRFLFKVDHGGHVPTGHVSLGLEGSSATISLSYPSSTSCLASLQASGSFGYAACDYRSDVDFMYFNVTVYSWPTYPRENNLYSHNGNPAETDFYCDTSRASGVVGCSFTKISTSNVRGSLYVALIMVAGNDRTFFLSRICILL